VTPLPAALGGGELMAWLAGTGDISRGLGQSAEGAYRAGGRWNSRGLRAVYRSIDPATAILEVAVHKGLKALDIVPHVLTAVTIT
jgi:RES domain-containing protein